MHHSTVLHDPKAVATPEQLKVHLAHKDRKERIARAAASPRIKSRNETYSRCVRVFPAAEEPRKTGEELVAEWTARQLERFKDVPLGEVEGDCSWPAEAAPERIEPKRPTVEAIQRAVAKFYNISRDDILAHRRTAAMVRPRQVAMYLAKILTLKSLPDIGRRFGDRDHTTVLHSVRKIESLCIQSEELALEVASLRSLFVFDLSVAMPVE